MTNNSPWLGTSDGTSFAAPVVSGTAALLMQRSGPLSTWPESVKAILMATALQNVEGNRRLSNKDGAGGVQADHADNVARGVNGGWGGIAYDGSRQRTQLSQIQLTSGQRVRVVIAWNQNPTYEFYAQRPSADLELEIVRPDGSVKVGSYSFDNNFEIVDFAADVTGPHRIRVVRNRLDVAPGYVGWAWYRP